MEIARALRSLLYVACCLLLITATMFAQDTATKGTIAGRIVDPTGAVIPGATVTASGPTGDRTAITNTSGDFEIGNLTPGTYSVKAEMSGFKAVSAPNVQVNVGKATSLRLQLEVGNVSQTVEVTAAEAAAVDLSSTAVGSNLSDQLYQNLPLGRAVSSLF